MSLPDRYVNNPDGWAVTLEGPDRGTAHNPATGQQMPFPEFVAWVYGISVEEACFEINGVLAEIGKKN